MRIIAPSSIWASIVAIGAGTSILNSCSLLDARPASACADASGNPAFAQNFSAAAPRLAFIRTTEAVRRSGLELPGAFILMAFCTIVETCDHCRAELRLPHLWRAVIVFLWTWRTRWIL
jgi:hypothetical protein